MGFGGLSTQEGEGQEEEEEEGIRKRGPSPPLPLQVRFGFPHFAVVFGVNNAGERERETACLSLESLFSSGL